jgi:hypothetical protein
MNTDGKSKRIRNREMARKVFAKAQVRGWSRTEGRGRREERNLDVTPDGRFLMLRRDAQEGHLRIVLN